MNKYDAENLQKRADQIRCINKRTSIFMTNFESFSFPVASFDRNGRIVRANRRFLEIAGVTDEDVQFGRENIFNCLDAKNERLADAVRGVFFGKERIYEGIGPVLRTNDENTAILVTRYPNAIFFPMTYGREGVELGAILLDGREKEYEAEPQELLNYCAV